MAALGALTAVTAAVWLLAQVAAVLAAAAVVCVVLRRSARWSLMSGNTVAVVGRRGGLPAPGPARAAAELVRAPYQIEAPPLAIAAPVASAVVPGVVEESRMKA